MEKEEAATTVAWILFNGNIKTKFRRGQMSEGNRGDSQRERMNDKARGKSYGIRNHGCSRIDT